MKLLRDRKVRDVLWQAAGAIGLIALVWFFVGNASQNMVKAGIASGFQFLWRDSGIEVPFNLTGARALRSLKINDVVPAIGHEIETAANVNAVRVIVD